MPDSPEAQLIAWWITLLLTLFAALACWARRWYLAVMALGVCNVLTFMFLAGSTMILGMTRDIDPRMSLYTRYGLIVMIGAYAFVVFVFLLHAGITWRRERKQRRQSATSKP